MCDFAYLIASNNALLDTASGASNTRCRSDGLVTICLNSGRDTLVLSGSSCCCTICYHANYGPYQLLLPYGVEALLRYSHNCFYGYGVGESTGIVCTSGWFVVVVCYMVGYTGICAVFN